jgi:hypothetical protein
MIARSAASEFLSVREEFKGPEATCNSENRSEPTEIQTDGEPNDSAIDLDEKTPAPSRQSASVAIHLKPSTP